jgi:hypothetical protein
MILVINGLIILSILLHWHYDFPSLQKGPPGYGDLILTLWDKNIKYTTLHSHERGVYDQMFLWKVQIQEEDMRQLSRSLWMKPVEKTAINKRFYSHSPYWWNPKPDEDNQYFMFLIIFPTLDLFFGWIANDSNTIKHTLNIGSFQLPTIMLL